MSQYRFVNNNGNFVLYGLDKPTGGYFVTELDKDEELISNKNTLTLRQLIVCLASNYYYILENFEIDKLEEDFENDPEPTELQRQINKMFGEMLDDNLKKVKKDLDN
jgi:hypothetical protein